MGDSKGILSIGEFMRRELSAGGVIFHKTTSRTKGDEQSDKMTAPAGAAIRSPKLQFKILLIKDGYGRWALPKGHVETTKGETPEQAALRECSEETGLPVGDLKIICKLGDVEYFFQLKGEKLHKNVHFYLVESISDIVKPQDEEIQDARWFEPDEAIAKNEYENSTAVIKKAVKIIKEAK